MATTRRRSPRTVGWSLAPSTSARRSAPARQRTSCCAGTTSTSGTPRPTRCPSRTTATSSSRTATPGTAAARISDPRAPCPRVRPRRTSAVSGTSPGTATHSTSSPTSTRASGAWERCCASTRPAVHVLPHGHHHRRRRSQDAERSSNLAANDTPVLPGEAEDHDPTHVHQRHADVDHRRVGGRLPGVRHVSTSGSTARSCR